ncbi:MAG TPA: helix-turn-helix domain-containing protein [Thermoleophilaceae bacterium]
MPTSSAYRGRGRQQRSLDTRARIMSAVRELLAEGTFHESTVEQVADRAGVSRATLYQHFRSRLELVDEMCDSFDANPALLALRESVTHADAAAALPETIAHTVVFWSSEDAILRQLYGVAAIDEAAADLVERQREDRRGEMSRLARHLRKAGVMRDDVSERQALALLMLLTSYESYRELRHAGLSDRAAEATLLSTAQGQLLA